MLEHLNSEEWPPLAFSVAALREALKENILLQARPLAYQIRWECSRCQARGSFLVLPGQDEKREVLVRHSRKAARHCLGTAFVTTERA